MPKNMMRNPRSLPKQAHLDAVTIATNMAGRGVDIKLGGNLPEEIVTNVNRILSHTGNPDPYQPDHARTI